MSGGSDGNDTFWPGYVDAISNLVLNLLFVVAILTIAVFLFAMELGRRQGAGAQKQKGATTEVSKPGSENSKNAAKSAAEKAELEAQIKSLKHELESVKAASAAATAAGGGKSASAGTVGDHGTGTTASAGGGAPANDNTPLKVLNASEKVAEPTKDVQKIQARAGGIVVVFAADAIALTSSEASKAKEALASVKSSGAAKVEVLVPAGFSETKRLAFYRAMAVRNLLIEMGLPNDKIEVSLNEVKSGGDSGRVMVRAR